MPELPEVEITARRLDAALRGATIESAQAPGINALKTFDPPLDALRGAEITGVRRRGKLLLIDFEGDLALLMHLMSAGRLQLYAKRASLRDRTARVLLRLPGDRELRLREFGSKQAAWVKLLTPEGLQDEDSLATLGPEAWPDPPALHDLLAQPRPLHSLLRDCTISELERVIEHYEHHVALPLPEKFPKPTRVHAHQGEPCPRCETVLEAVFFEDYVMTYCPYCQTEGRVLKDRRLSRLLK